MRHFKTLQIALKALPNQLKLVTQTAILNEVLTDSVEIGCKQLDEVK